MLLSTCCVVDGTNIVVQVMIAADGRQNISLFTDLQLEINGSGIVSYIVI